MLRSQTIPCNSGITSWFVLNLLVAILALPVVSGPSVVAQSSNWKPFGNTGSNVDTESQSLPDTFGPDQNVLWKTPVIAGSSSRCIFGDRISLTGQDGDQLAVLCFSGKSGEQLWQPRRSASATACWRKPGAA